MVFHCLWNTFFRRGFGMKSNADRLREIISVLGSYGFGTLYKRQFKKQTVEESAANLRQAFELLGPSFIKIGQILSTRNDLLPEAYIRELEKLQNSSPTIPYKMADTVFKEEIGKSMADTFAEVQEQPLATGSIAQIHLAKLENGKVLAVKIQRPNIRQELIRDIDLFIRALSSVPGVTNIMVNPVDVLKQIRVQSVEELDFLNEARNMLTFIENNQQNAAIQAPEPYMPLITERVLVQEYIEGYDLTDIDKITELGYDKTDIARKIVVSYLYQIFSDGFYHADPHPGNFIISEGQLYFIDFGIADHLSNFYQNFFLGAMQALLTEDIDALMNMLLLITKHHEEVNTISLYDDLSELYNRYLRAGFYAIDLSEIFDDIFSLGLKYHLVFPDDLVLLLKTIVMVQGVSQDLDPDMDFMGLFASYIIGSKTVDIKSLLSRNNIMKYLSRLINSSVNIPPKTELLLDNINHNRLTVNLAVKDVERLEGTINRMLNRFVATFLLSAIIISSGMIASSATSVTVSNIAILFFVVGIFLALYLLYSLIRSRL